MTTINNKDTALTLAFALVLGCACSQPPDDVRAGPSVAVRYTERRAACAERNPLRSLYFGDLHAHTLHSWDAYGYDLRVTPSQAYAFARGDAPVMLPPLDAEGRGTRAVRIDRPLDFVAITDHSEYLGETLLCRTQGSSAYDSAACRGFREGGEAAVATWGVRLGSLGNARDSELCGEDGGRCEQAAAEAWRSIAGAAEQAYDRTAACGFVSFVGYEYTATPTVTNLHRNVIFRNAEVPAAPISYFEQKTPWGLWMALKRSCLDGGAGCDAIVIPHNSNWSNGAMFLPSLFEEQGAAEVGSAEEAAALRATLEPLVEIFQHKGDMECENGLSGATRVGAAEDPHCNNEKLRLPLEDCGDEAGVGGVKDQGCVSRYDFLRGILHAGLALEPLLGLNPYRLGVIGSTDTHNGTPGNTAEQGWPGHVGISDDTPLERLGQGNITHRGRVNNPGGLAAVWAVERSRDAIFEAFTRREVYSTSGTRLAVRLFGGFGLGARLAELGDCAEASSDELAKVGYAAGVPMGGTLPASAPAKAAAPELLIDARYDPGSDSRPGALLQRVQVVKGWLDEAGKHHERVYTVAGEPAAQGARDPATCRATEKQRGGQKRLCALWRDPDFDPGQPAFYYVRVLEQPVCRWSTRQCNALSAAERPEGCDDPLIEKVIQERAVTSPIWHAPTPR